MTGIFHAAIVAAITVVADALINTRQILTSTVSTIDLQILTLVHVDGTIGSGVSSALAVAPELVHFVVALAVILAGHIAFRIWRAVIDVDLAIHAGVTDRAGAFRYLLFYIIIIK